MQYVIWGLLLLLLLEILVFFYVYIYLPLRRVKELTEDLAEGKQREGKGAIGALGLESLVRNLSRIDEKIAKLGYHVSAEKLNLHTIVANIVEGVMVVDAQGNIQIANDALMSLFGLAESPVEKNVHDALGNATVESLIEETLRQQQRFSREMMLAGHQGKRVFEVNAVPLMNLARGQCAGAVATFHDITEIRALDGMRREFISNVSHELRTPLTVFKSYLETLVAHPEWLSGDAPAMAQTLQRHSERLNALVDDLLTLSRFESGQMTLDIAAVDTPAFLRRIEDDWSKLIAQKGHRFHVAREETLPPVAADPLRLEEVFSNLLENSLHYLGKNGALEIGGKRGDAAVMFYVKDNGAGITAEKLPRIFDRFFRADEARSRALGGTGLGLAIVKNIVELQGGKIWAESEVGKGTTVFFTVPIAAEANQ